MYRYITIFYPIDHRSSKFNGVKNILLDLSAVNPTKKIPSGCEAQKTKHIFPVTTYNNSLVYLHLKFNIYFLLTYIHHLTPPKKYYKNIKSE